MSGIRIVKIGPEWDGDLALHRWHWARTASRWTGEVGPKLRDKLVEAAPAKPEWDHPERGAPGRLKASITQQRAGEAVLEFHAHTPYARFVVSGTTAHGIRPVAARWLHWVDPRGVHFRKRVRHPGATANPFPERVLTEQRGMVVDEMRTAVEDTFRR
ncbi:HK97 gp10 family phage protein [Amycolatopsis cynarae]|uniref:HK97 gp10 family phage protein n=1 Tax=Amycolatopsis cynarae TaxID=2995223 RepID=A0ABY7B5C4_9PSEU|nr:HK97 gp10 family phage protein [Amycolatopsis sp. HUAS 11-8]WAL67145.1 HK97 gp10 family phage protein [Amycolatopsis sp. HUAS 11-8]